MTPELTRLFRFCVTGFAVAVTYVLGYVALSYLGLSPLAANTTAFVVAVVVQYVMQAGWTFQRRLTDAAQGARFTTIIGLGLGYSTLFAASIGPALGWSGTVTAMFVAVSLPLVNYIAFRLWVFGRNPTQECE